MMRKALLSLCFLGTAALTGCSSLLTTEAPERIYTLYGTVNPHPVSVTASQAKTARPSLTVQVATVAPGLASEQVWARDGQRLTPISNVRWAERAPELLEKQITYYLEGSELFSYVTHQRGGPRTELFLVTDLRALYVDMKNGKPQAVTVALSARLVEGLRSQPLVNLVLEEREPLQVQDADQLAGAFHRASERLLKQVQDACEAALL